jgi:formate-dependent nitrite reductase membrane component NrfD
VNVGQAAPAGPAKRLTPAADAPGRDGDVRTYYDEPILREPAWTVEVPWYFFAGGTAGAASLLAAAADLAGDRRLGRAAARVAAAGAVVSPVLLIKDLGRPLRFSYMLRVFKVTSPLSVGSWVLSAYAPAAIARWALDELGVAPGLRRLSSGGAALLGPVMAAYTAVLVADTAVPVWHHARRELPFVFVTSSAASAGAAALVAGAPGARTARTMTVSAAALELATEQAMQRRLGDLGHPYEHGRVGAWAKAAKVLTGAGAVAVAVSRSRRWVERLGAAAVVAGSLCQRFAVFRAGFASTRDARALVRSQRAGGGRGRAGSGC